MSSEGRFGRLSDAEMEKQIVPQGRREHEKGNKIGYSNPPLKEHSWEHVKNNL
jgi:hypothetical protein